MAWFLCDGKRKIILLSPLPLFFSDVDPRERVCRNFQGYISAGVEVQMGFIRGVFCVLDFDHMGREGMGAWEWGWGNVVVAQRRDTVWGSPTAGWRVILVNIILAKIVTFTIRRPDRSIMSG